MTKNSHKNLQTPSNKLNIGLKMDILWIFFNIYADPFWFFLYTMEQNEYKKGAQLTFFTS